MRTFISTDDSRKAHFEFDFQRGMSSCNSGSPVTVRLAEVEGEGIDQVIAALRTAEVKPSRLCRKCFFIRTRAAYSARLAAPNGA